MGKKKGFHSSGKTKTAHQMSVNKGSMKIQKLPTRKIESIKGSAYIPSTTSVHLKREEDKTRKIFIVNTDIFLHDPCALANLKDNKIIIPLSVLDELGEFKKDKDELGANSRAVAKYLSEVPSDSFKNGAKLKSGGTLFIDTEEDVRSLAPLKHRKDTTENKLLAVALKQQQENKDTPVIIITNDINLRNKAKAYGIKAEEYKNDKVSVYNGFQEIEVNEKLFDNIRKNGRAICPIGSNIMPNEFVIIKNGRQETIETICKGDFLVHLPKLPSVFGITARNPEQRFALHLLLDPDITLVTIGGRAGSGKTLLVLAAAFKQLLDKTYRRISVARPIEPMGKDIGFLPGGVEEKMGPWVQPINDNMYVLFSNLKEQGSEKNTVLSAHEEETQQRKFRKEKKKDNKKTSAIMSQSSKGPENGRPKAPWQKYIDQGLLYIEPLTYLRGRTLPNQFIFIDEVQNLPGDIIKTIITRAGEGAKIVLTGDIDQIDSPYLNEFNNGLSVVAYNFKNIHLAGHITLTESVRSELAKIGSEIL